MNYGKEFKNYATKHHGISAMHFDKITSSMTPYIIEERQMNVAQMDVFSRLMMDRVMFLGTAIDDQVANVIQAQLLFLQSVDPKRDIQMYINSPGGSVYAGLGIYDTMQYISPDVATICTGMAASMGAVLLCAGQKGKRTALPHSRVMIHQPLGGTLTTVPSNNFNKACCTPSPDTSRVIEGLSPFRAILSISSIKTMPFCAFSTS